MSISINIFGDILKLAIMSYDVIQHLDFWALTKICSTVFTKKIGNVYFPRYFRSMHPEVFLGKGVLRICSKFTGEHSCQSAISIKLLFATCFANRTSAWVFFCISLEQLFLRTPLDGCLWYLLATAVVLDCCSILPVYASVYSVLNGKSEFAAVICLYFPRF